MKVGELIQLLEKFDKDLEIRGSGHFGEKLDIYQPYLGSEGFVILETEDAGDEPD